jgi:VanZ family protein
MDKIAHLLEYALFGLLAGRAIRATFSGWSAVAFTIATAAFGGLVGLLDEYYQRSVPGRQSDPFDLLVDVSAVAAAVVFAQWVHILPFGGGSAGRSKGR